MEWKELNLIADNVASNQSFFDEKLGLNSKIEVRLEFYDESNKQLDFYIQRDDGYFSKYSRMSLYDLRYKLLTPKPAAIKREARSNGGLSCLFAPNYKISDFIDFVPAKIKVTITGSETQKSIVYVVKSIKEISKIKLWMYKGRASKLIYPELNDIKKGMKLYNSKFGIVTIDKIYDRSTSIPLNDFAIKDNDGKKHDVVNKKDGFYKLPSDGYKQNIFNDFLNETKLDACISVDKQFNLINVYWHEIEDTACYKIKFYKKNRNNDLCIDELYFLKEIEVNHHTCYLSINDLVTTNIVIVVLAEDREGNVIAKTRGITDSVPREFKFEGE